MAPSQNPPRQLNAALLFAMAVVVILVLTLVAVLWGSEDAKSVEDRSAAQAEAAVAAIELPDGTTISADSTDETDTDVTFDGVVARRQRNEGSGSGDTARESASALDPAAEVCSDETLTNLCNYALGEPIATPTPQPTPTPAPTTEAKAAAKDAKKPSSKSTTSRRAQSTPTPGSTDNRSRPATTPTRAARPLPATVTPAAPTPIPTPVTEIPQPPASTPTPAPVIETPPPPAATPTAAPIVDVSPTEPAEPSDPVAGSDTDAPGDVVYIYTEPPSDENPSPPVMECLVSADGSLDCPEAGA